MAAPTNANPTLTLNLPGYDPTGNQVNVAIKLTNITTDPDTGVVYGDISTAGTATVTGTVGIIAADGSIATLGLKADSAITDATTTNTEMSFIKGLVKIIADVWDSTNHLLHQNIKQVGGTAIATNTGNASAGCARVAIVTDQPVLPVNNNATVAGGATYYHLVSAGSTNATNIKASAAKLCGYTISNTNASPLCVKFYDTAGTPSAGSGTIRHTVQVPGGSTVARIFKDGVSYATGLAFVTVTTLADAGSTGVAANDLSIDVDYV